MSPQHITDLRTWREAGLIAVANWNVDGFPINWHIEQVRKGNRFVPTFKLELLGPGTPTYIGRLPSADNEAFLRDAKIPVSLRGQNIAQIFTLMPRLPEAEESIPNSPIVWRRTNGVLTDEAIVDVFGPPSIWRKAGEDWGRSAHLAELQRRFPDAPTVLLADNNEANVDKVGFYLDGSVKSAEYYGDPLYKWFPDLESRSVRAAQYAATGKTPDDFRRDFNVLDDAQYNALYSGFNSSLTAWKDRLLSESYKIPTFTNTLTTQFSANYSPEFGHTDAGGGSLYVESGPLTDFTSTEWFQAYLASPVHLKAEELNPRHIREVFLELMPGGTFQGYQQGRHEVIDEARYCAHIQWLLWSMRGKGKPLLLRYWTKSQNRPETPFADTDAARAILDDAGYPEMASATEEMPIRAINTAVNKILDNPVLRRFWLEGNPVQTGTHPANEWRLKKTNKPRTFPAPGDRDEGFRLLDCDINTPRSEWLIPPSNLNGRWNEKAQIKVWGNATELNGEYLLHFFTPCKTPLSFTTTLPNGWRVPVRMDAAGSYVLVKPNGGFVAEEIE